jgi:putative ABC transport system permease protein
MAPQASFPDLLRVARDALRANRLRTWLTLLGVVIGVATVIAMASLVNGFERSFLASIQTFSQNTIYVRTFRPGLMFTRGIPDSLRRRHAFTAEDARAIEQECPAVAVVSIVKPAFGMLRVERGGHVARTEQTFGTDVAFLRTRGFEVAEGRFFTEVEVQRRANVVVIGHDTRLALFQDASAIGRKVSIGGIPFVVVGEFTLKGKVPYHNLNDMVCMPWTTVTKYWRTPRRAPPWYAPAQEVFLDVLAVSPARVSEAKEQLRGVLRQRRHVPAQRSDGFEIFDDDAFMSLYHTITGGIVTLMMLVSSIALIVGGIGIMDVMWVAVTERAHEIGLRKAVGAPRRSILFQFLAEAVALSTAGGLLGLALGVAIAWLVRVWTGLPTYVSLGSVLAGVGVSVAVGVFSGLYPALRAARLDPVASLRNE